jgi:secreted PhoX family phosphatase
MVVVYVSHNELGEFIYKYVSNSGHTSG